jgi:thiol-disulfide isomerase/thioredoxin
MRLLLNCCIAAAFLMHGLSGPVYAQVRLQEIDTTPMNVAWPFGVSVADATSQRLGFEGRFPKMTGGTEWLNSPPLKPEDLRGKVVLVNVWTYSCINSLRPLPFVRAWAEKYRTAGLVTIGVHSPEFVFEKVPANVRRAVTDMHLVYPVVLDNDFAIWRAFGNQYWPAFYFIDAQGRIRDHRFGEEHYEQSERVLQQLLAEAGATNIPTGFVKVAGVGIEAPPSAVVARSEETYLGYAKANSFISPDRVGRDRARLYRASAPAKIDEWSLAGTWSVERERVVLAVPGGRIAYRFHGRDLHLVLGATDASKPVRFRVSVDGKPPLSDHGWDTDAQGNGTIDGHRLYQLVRQVENSKDRLFEIVFFDAGAQAYVFTFG